MTAFPSVWREVRQNMLDKNIINRSDLVELGDIIMNKNNGRLSENDITVADLTGVAVQDIMITNKVYNNLNQL